MMNQADGNAVAPAASRWRRYGTLTVLIATVALTAFVWVAAATWGGSSTVTRCEALPVQVVPSSKAARPAPVLREHCHTVTSGHPAPTWVSTTLRVVLVVLLLAVLYAVVKAIRTPPGFVRLAEGLTTWALALYGAGIVLMLVIIAFGSNSARLDLGNVEFGSSKLFVAGSVNGAFSSSGSSDDAYERHMARRSFGPHATLTQSGDRGFEVAISKPSAKVVGLSVFSGVWHAAALLFCLYALRTVLASTLKGDPFGERPLRWMRWLAFGLLLAGPGSAIVSHLTTKEILHAIGGSGYGLAWHVSSLPILGAILVFALSEVWRYGNQLQREVEATV